MSEDQEPIDATRSFEAVDPYNIPGYEQQPYNEPRPAPSPGFKQRLNRLGPLKLAVLATAGVIVLGGAAWGTTTALQSSGSSSNTAAAAPAQTSSAAGAGATDGKGTGKHKKTAKIARIKITQIGNGSFTGTAGKDGATVTVDYDAQTRFGSKARPLTSDKLQVGMTVVVAGTRQGDTVTATLITAPAGEQAAAADT